MSQLVNVRLPNWVAFAVRRRRLRFFGGAVVNTKGGHLDDSLSYVPLMARWRRERCDDMRSMKLDVKPENPQSIRERVAVVCAYDAGDSCERKRAT
jgi:hypothetical protein